MDRRARRFDVLVVFVPQRLRSYITTFDQRPGLLKHHNSSHPIINFTLLVSRVTFQFSTLLDLQQELDRSATSFLKSRPIRHPLTTFAMANKTTMRALTLAAYGAPSTYDLATLPIPTIPTPDAILIEVRAASINPIDVKRANGLLKALQSETFPLQLGYDVSGRVVQVGEAVTRFQPGDDVYSRVPSHLCGTVAEYVLSVESATALKPAGLSYTQAASVPLAGLTALQSLDIAANILPGGLEGKTVLVPAGLSGTGSFAIQLSKNVFGAEKVITTLSTAKIEKAKELLGAQTFEAIDYTKQDVTKAVAPASVDYAFDTVNEAVSLAKLVKPGGVIISISSLLPSGGSAAQAFPELPVWLKYILIAAHWVNTRWIGWYGVKYDYLFMHPSSDDLGRFTEWIDAGKIKPIVGRTAKLDDIEAVRSGCQEIYDGKGGIGKFVIEI